MTAVTLTNLRRMFADGFVAVDDLSISIVAGEFLTLLGPSGCGKSTTLRMIAGLDAPDDGDIRFDDRRMNDIAPGKRNIAMVFQSYALYPHMTVRRNLEYPLRKQGVAKAERTARAEAVAELMQLRDLLERKPRELSGGQQQRVALGRALIRNPDLFLFDEPLSNLDAKLRSYMRAELIQLHRRVGKTMIYVTHDQLEAMTMSDRVAIMDKGRLQQLGTPHEVYNAPANLFVASFIGAPTMNLVQGELARAGDGAVFRAGSLEVAAPSLAGGTEAGAAVLGVRPEDVLVEQGDLPATVNLIEPVGHETLLSLDVLGHRVVARTDAQTRLTYGATTTVAFRPGKLHLFDGKRGHRLA
ncbi:MAG: ABC transporter ATP-binding protein [Reyranellaceae bacterium]